MENSTNEPEKTPLTINQTVLKVEKTKETMEKHCLCDSNDYSTFMICCDYCGVWYHGDCVQISRTLAKKIEKYFCLICISKENSLEVVYKDKGKKERTPKFEERKEQDIKEKRNILTSTTPSTSSITHTTTLTTNSTGSENVNKALINLSNSKTSTKKCGNCIGCLWETDCNKCSNCISQQQPCLKRICVQANNLTLPASNGFNTDSTQSAKKTKAIKKETEDSDSKTVPRSPVYLSKFHKRKESNGLDVKVKREALSNSINIAEIYNNYYHQKKRKKDEEEKQCFGPSCVNSARPNSSYCSDECGLALAERRLKYILPERIHAFYNEKPVVECEDEEKLHSLMEKHNELENELKLLDECFENVTNWISTISNQIGSSEQTTVDDGSFMVSCAVCTMEFSIRNIGKHMQRCFVRTERQSTYGTAQKLPQNPKNLYCDAYNKVDKSYCKRLRVMCSEHYKDEDEIKICGAPLLWFEGRAVEFKKLFVEPEILIEHMFCMEKRKHCNVHTNWAQNALGLIDNERMNILYQLDENIEKRRLLKQKRATRGDIISLLCNYTISEKNLTIAKIAEIQSKHLENDITMDVKTENFPPISPENDNKKKSFNEELQEDILLKQ